MGLIVQKFGGTSVANAERLRNVAEIIAETYRQGNQVVAVLSAQGDTTDDLIEKAQEINPKASRREMDMLLSTGEQISCSLCAMAVEALGLPVVSLTGWQAGVQTNSSYSSARIKKIDVERIQSEIDRNHSIVIVTGFQGINKYGDITTLGRGGSDTSAVAIAASMHADLCQIFTDVEGVYKDYEDKSSLISEMTVEEALPFFENLPRLYNKLQTLYEVGLSYVKLGQPSTTLSGGEAQRVKLATELAKRSTGKTIYILDEPTTGLHTADVHKLIEVLQKLVDVGNTVVVIEHNLDVIKTADHIIDLGPEGGDGGGNIVVTGTPEEVAQCAASYTGQYLKRML